MILIHNGIITNSDSAFLGYLITDGEFIKTIAPGTPSMELLAQAAQIIDAHGGLIIPGVIDDQVHFREPGLTQKGTIATESRAAVAGGVTSFMEMPNTKPASVTLSLLEQKYDIAAEVSPANYSFYLGATNDNISEIRNIDPSKICGVKIFMGSSTGNMLVDRRTALEEIFAESPVIITTHCEDEAIVSANLKAAFEKYGAEIPISMHPAIRSAEACYKSSAQAIELADKAGANLHILHISTAQEMSLFSDKPLAQKKITAEVCAHHLFYSSDDYTRLGSLIKCNPAIKSPQDRAALRQALANGKLDIVATDHAPHNFDEKQNPYTTSPSGLPLVQHSLQLMLEMDIISPEKVVEKMCHNPAIRYQIDRRGFLKEGYYADIVVVEKTPQTINKDNILYKCAWSPLEGTTLAHTITYTIVNGAVAFENGKLTQKLNGQRLKFNR